ncbi:MAG: dTDP-4-dehydrorhamnose 3,5-epimerase [Syntrophobacteraceae bacterium]
MIFTETGLKGAFTVEMQRLEDERGFFARSWCRREFEAHGLDPGLVQCSISFNLKAGTLRGMHYQAKPFEESKLIRCTRGAVHDVIVDLRPESPTFGQYASCLLTSENRRMLFVPKSFAHGFVTLEDETEVFYQMSEFYSPEHAMGFRWNDPRFAIDWPCKINVISERDRNYPDFTQFP